MPYKPKKPCARPGCPNLTHGRYCDDHAKEDMRNYNRHERDPSTNKLYGRDWKKIRAAFLSANPLCEMCKDNGKFAPAIIAHHKIKLTNGGTNAKDNLASLCESCHSRLHAEQGDRW